MTQQDLIEALVQIEDGSRWLAFADPVRVVQARDVRDVTDAIREVEALATTRGWYAVGFVAYEAAAAFGLTVCRSRGEWPLVWFALFEAGGVRSVDRPASTGEYRLGPVQPSVDRRRFAGALQRIHAWIADGHTYQVNYTFRIRRTFSGDPRVLFADLVSAQRCRYGVFVGAGSHAICSASPELFFARHGTTVVTRPMKGTTRRGRTCGEDLLEARRLRDSVKQRAENVMIVDMMRNDLGRIAEVGSVGVPELFTLERYPNVWQMTSTVTARTSARLHDLFTALHPSASVTGAPKIRTMEIVRELEAEPRGIYTGAIGYVAPDGTAQFNVAIRTAVVDLAAGLLEFGVGSGVVWDSEADEEHDECLLKGSILGSQPPSFELLETLGWTREHGFFLLERHLRRLQDSAEYFGFRCSIDQVVEALERAVRSAACDMRVRLLVAEDGTTRTEAAPLDPPRDPVRIGLATSAIDQSDVFLFHKTTNRRSYERVRREDCEEVVLWNSAGQVTEATTANLVVEIDGRKLTPPVECGLLAGTFRAELLAHGDVVEAPITIEQLFAASRVWLVNSVRGWRTAQLMNHKG